MSVSRYSMSDFDWGNMQVKEMSSDQIAKTLNKKVTLFGTRTDEIAWALKMALIPFMAAFFGLTLMFVIFGLPPVNYVMQDVVRSLMPFTFVILIVATFINVLLIKRLNRVFGDGAALLALSTTSVVQMILFPTKAKKNFGFDVQPNNNFKRIE